MSMYNNIPTDGCNIEIMGFPFFAESINVNEAFRRREANFNNIVGGTMKVTPGAYVGLDFTVTTHVTIDPERPDEHNSVFQEMMSKPVEVVSPEIGGRFNAVVVIKPERKGLDWLELSISIKEIPDKNSLIPGEEFIIPKSKKVEVKKETKKDKDDKKKDTKKDGKRDTKKDKKKDTKKDKKKNKKIGKKSKSNTKGG